MIIYGTGYYGKRNVSRVRDTCEACGHTGHLESYDGTRFFSLYFIPLIPLGSHHISHMCPACKKGRMLPMAQWNKIKTEQIGAAISAHAQDAKNRDLAEKALGAVVASDDHFGFYDVALKIEENFASDADVLARLAWSYNYFLMDEEATAAYLASLNIKDDADVRHALAVHLMHLGRVDDAAAQVDLLPIETEAKHAGAAVLLASAFQTEGRHDEALAVLERLDADKLDDAALLKELNRLNAISQKHQGSQKKVASPHLMKLGKAPAAQKQTSTARRWAPFLTIPVIIAIALAAWVWACAVGGGQVLLVNGLDEPMDVLINGTPYHVNAKSHRPIDVPFGTVTIQPAPASVPVPAAQLTLNEPFFSRAGSDRVFVINPDQSAIMLWEEDVYQTTPDPATYKYQVHVGKPLHEFDDIDYVMTQMPQTITLSSNSSKNMRHSVNQLTNMTPMEALGFLDGEVPPAEIAAFLKATLTCQPGQANLIHALVFFAGDEPALKFIEARLGDRPVLVNWHRAYHTLIERLQPDRDLYSEYVKLAEAEPANQDLAYLAGRLASDPEVAMQWFEKAIGPPAPCAYAHYAIGFQHANYGRFAEALAAVRQARQIDQANSEFENREQDLLEATGKLDRVIAQRRKLLDETPLSVTLAMDVVRLMMQSGDEAEADRVIRNMLDAVKNEDPIQLAEVDAYLACAKADGKADADAYAAAAAMLKNSGYRFHALAIRGSLDEAVKVLDDPDIEDRALNRLLLYVLAEHAGNTELAAKQLAVALDMLRKGSKDDRKLAAALSGDEPPPLKTIIMLANTSEDSRIILAAVGLKFPAARQTYFDLARKHNYRRTFPHTLLVKVLEAN